MRRALCLFASVLASWDASRKVEFLLGVTISSLENHLGARGLSPDETVRRLSEEACPL
ncbi:hypothetical protein A2U01_0002289 [Trifolium medium]|uniref:Uncharacterized protein n=1 Tax=Trifolium medium TaxID=97028 RepID=A0A392M2H0_9FABA|nr:hypothetical protein [Trifolium medium]